MKTTITHTDKEDLPVYLVHKNKCGDMLYIAIDQHSDKDSARVFVNKSHNRIVDAVSKSLCDPIDGIISIDTRTNKVTIKDHPPKPEHNFRMCFDGNDKVIYEIKDTILTIRYSESDRYRVDMVFKKGTVGEGVEFHGKIITSTEVES